MKIERTDGTGAIDRRVARTRALLQDALIALIPENGYAAITVEDICEKANVGRSTFYTHYAGKDELRSATLDAHLRSLSRARMPAGPDTNGRRFAFSLPMFEHVQAFRSLVHDQAPLSRHDDTIRDLLRDRIQRAVRSELAEARSGKGDAPAEFAVQFISGAFLAVLAWWTEANVDLSPAEADALFQQMAASGLGGAGR